MKVAEALQLINSGDVQARKNNFASITSWMFEQGGIEYRVAEWEGIGVKLEIASPLPRRTLDYILFKEDYPHAKDFIGLLERRDNGGHHDAPKQ